MPARDRSGFIQGSSYPKKLNQGRLDRRAFLGAGLTAAAAWGVMGDTALAGTEFLTIPVGCEHLLRMPGVLLEEGDHQFPLTQAELSRLRTATVRSTNSKVVRGDLHMPNWVRLTGLRTGQSVVTLTTLDQKSYTFIIHVTTADKAAGAGATIDMDRTPLVLGVGHDRILTLPEKFLEGRFAPWIATVDPKVLDIAPLSAKQIRVMGMGPGTTDLTLISAGDQLTPYRATVVEPNTKIPHEPQKTVVRMKVGETRPLSLPAKFLDGDFQPSISSVLPRVADVSAGDDQQPQLTAKSVGVSDVTLISASAQATLYRVIVEPSPERQPAAGPQYNVDHVAATKPKG